MYFGIVKFFKVDKRMGIFYCLLSYFFLNLSFLFSQEKAEETIKETAKEVVEKASENLDLGNSQVEDAVEQQTEKILNTDDKEIAKSNKLNFFFQESGDNYRYLLRRGKSLVENPSDLDYVSSQDSYWQFHFAVFPIPFGSVEVDLVSPISIGAWNYLTKGGIGLTKKDIEEIAKTLSSTPTYLNIEIPNLLSVRVWRIMFNISFNGILNADSNIEDITKIYTSNLSFGDKIEGKVNVNAFAYLKSSLGYGHSLNFPKIGAFKIGGNLNMYLGIGGDAKSFLDFTNANSNLSGEAEAIINLPFPAKNNDIFGGISEGFSSPSPTFGIDLSFSYIPEIFKMLEFRMSITDLFASIAMSKAYRTTFFFDFDTERLDISSLINSNSEFKIEDVYNIKKSIGSEYIDKIFPISPKIKLAPLFNMDFLLSNWLIESIFIFYPIKEGLNNPQSIDFSVINHFLFSFVQFNIGLSARKNTFNIPFGLGVNFNNFEFLLNVNPYLDFFGGLSLKGIKLNLLMNVYFSKSRK